MIVIKSNNDKTPDEIFNIGVVNEVKSWQEVVDFILKENTQNKTSFILSSFDDYHQACYTSGHATGNDELDYSPPDEEEVDYDSTLYYQAAFEHRLKALRASDFSDLSTLMGRIELSQEDIEILIKVNADPLQVCDLPLKLDQVPVLKSFELLAYFPNGYFSCDLNTFENKILSDHLTQNFDYQLIAIGASFLGFAQKEPLNSIQAEKLLEQLSALYGVRDKESLQPLGHLCEKQNYLFLPYVESLDVYDSLLEQ